MRKLIRRWLGIEPREGYESLPDPLEDEKKILTKISVVDCEGGGRVITTERRTSQGWEHKVYIVPEDGDIMNTIAVILVEARLK